MIMRNKSKYKDEGFMNHNSFEERFLRMIFTLAKDETVMVSDSLSAAIEEILSQIDETRNPFINECLRKGRSIEEVVQEFGITEDIVTKDKERLITKIKHPQYLKKLSEFIKKPCQDHLKKIIRRYSGLMTELEIDSPDSLIKALGDRYDSEKRKVLMSELSQRDRAWLKGYYLRYCNAGKDRFLACIKVKIDWNRGPAWTPKNQDYLTEISAEYDRIDSSVTYDCRSANGAIIQLKYDLDEAFEDDFFGIADAAQFEEIEQRKGSYAFDYNPVAIACEFPYGIEFNMNGIVPDYYPYDKLYEKHEGFFSKFNELSLLI